MDEQNNLPSERTRSTIRPAMQRPPIQWPVRSAQQSADNQRAAALARQHVERTYAAQGEPNQINEATPAITEPQPEQTAQSEQTIMRQEPYDWRQYHSAWQQYYHQYFYRYYAGWWHQQKQQIEKQAHEQAAQHATLPKKELTERQRATQELRQKVRTTVEERSKKVKSSSHFKPVMAALVVGVSFLLINYNQILVGAIKQYVAPGSVVTTPVIVEPNTQANVGQEPKIIIPKIGVEVPVVYDEPNVDEASYQKALERGVVRLGTTANPGTKGNVVIGGHSSNNVFNAGAYKYVFVNLRRLEVGDVFYLNYRGLRYTYKITVAHKIVSPTDVSVLGQTETPTVTLFTCDPPGTNVNRLIVQAEQIDPSPASAVASTAPQTKVNDSNPLPSVAPSLWDRLFR